MCPALKDAIYVSGAVVRYQELTNTRTAESSSSVMESTSALTAGMCLRGQPGHIYFNPQPLTHPENTALQSISLPLNHPFPPSQSHVMSPIQKQQRKSLRGNTWNQHCTNLCVLVVTTLAHRLQQSRGLKPHIKKNSIFQEFLS